MTVERSTRTVGFDLLYEEMQCGAIYETSFTEKMLLILTGAWVITFAFVAWTEKQEFANCLFVFHNNIVEITFLKTANIVFTLFCAGLC